MYMYSNVNKILFTLNQQDLYQNNLTHSLTMAEIQSDMYNSYLPTVSEIDPQLMEVVPSLP